VCYKEGIWRGLNSWCLKKYVWNLATVEEGWGQGIAYVIVFVEIVVW
jgi:hypothetical protein